MAPLVEDLIKLLDSTSNSLRRGRYPDRPEARKIAGLLRAFAEQISPVRIPFRQLRGLARTAPGRLARARADTVLACHSLSLAARKLASLARPAARTEPRSSLALLGG